ncbi:hypothetical protein [uncultured Alistipes sp.]|uniref:hypothetical protein n=1 Tax=uncultured Alistipes sp. TaxID=538949 RepID=UPI00261D5914|nr:hypothetical protein [uncultured Alistipes sp.]
MAEKKRNGLQLNKEKRRQNGKGEAKRAMEQKDLKFQVFFLLEHSLSCRIFPSLFSPHQREIHVDSGEGSSEKASTENPPDSDHTDSPKRRFHAAVSL